MLVNGRPVVRMNDLTEHCGGTGKMIEGSVNIFIGGPSVLAPQVSTEVIANYILDEMLTNIKGDDVSYMRGKNDFTFFESLIPLKPTINKGQASWRFFNLVHPGGDWDHKGEILEHYGNWAHDSTSDTSYQYDTWSNIHYGYVGAASGFSDFELTSGAGFAQIMAGTSDVSLLDPEYWSRRTQELGDADFLAAFDDPKDQAAVNLGIKLWEEYGEDLTVEQILDALRHTEGLATAAGPQQCCFMCG